MTTEYYQDPNSPWQPLTPAEYVIDDEWLKNTGFKFSELGLTREAAGIFTQPFRSEEERIAFLTMREQGLIPQLKEPVPLEEIKEKKYSSEDVTRLMVERLGGQDGVKTYINQHVTLIKGFRILKQRLGI